MASRTIVIEKKTLLLMGLGGGQTQKGLFGLLGDVPSANRADGRSWSLGGEKERE